MGLLGTVMAGTVKAAPAASPEESETLPAWPEGPGELVRWREAKRSLLATVNTPTLKTLAEAAAAGERLVVRYYGGTQWGAPREITPGALFRVEGFWPTYLEAFCHDRQAMRTFVVERMEVVG